MARRSLPSRFTRALRELFGRGFDAASGNRFPREARSGRTATETQMAAPRIRGRGRYFYGSDGHAAAAANTIVTYGVGAGPIPAHADADLVSAFVDQWWNECDADGRSDFGGLIALALLEMVVAGECFVLFVQRPEGLRLRLIPAEQVDESLSRELGAGGWIDAGIEFNARGERVAYHIRPHVPSSQFESWAPPVRIDAADVLHLFRPIGVGQQRGVSWFAPILLKLADLGLLSDALLKGFQVAALHAGFITDANGNSDFPYDGTQAGSTLESGLEPGMMKRLPSGFDVKFNNPQAANQSVEFMTAMIEEIAAGLGVPAFMVSGNVSRANYSSLRAALITFKANLEAIQFNVLVPQLLAPIWRRWVLTEQLRGTTEADPGAAEWRFPAMPEADPVKQVTATKLLLDAKLMSRREAIAQRGESIERVDADISADPNAAKPKEEPAHAE